MTPNITITDSAAVALREALGDSDAGDVIHLMVSPSFEHGLDLGPTVPEAIQLDCNGLILNLDPASASLAEGVTIDYVDGDLGAGFRIENPNAPPKIVELGPAELQSRLESGTIKVLIDVRTPWEREIATLANSLLLDQDSNEQIAALPKDTPIAFYCHHGVRSRMAASQFIAQGFTKVFNLAGGIEAWSQTVDGAIPRY